MSSKNLKLPKIDKRQLFLDRNRKNYIEFDLEKTKTCSEIYNSLNEEINKKIEEIYTDKKEKNLDFKFIVIYSRSTSKWDTSSLIEVKLDKDAELSEIMSNKLNFLCYLPENKFNIIKKKNARNKLKEEDLKIDRFREVERRTSNHEIEKYLSYEGIYYFDKEKVEFIYGKGNVDEEKIIINYKKTNIEIPIKEIKKEQYFENQIPPSIEVFKIKCPNFIFQIHQNNVTHFLGLYKQKSYLIWKNAISMAKIKNINNTIDSTFNSDIYNYNYLLFVKRHSIPSKCFIINQILENSQKRHIFLDQYKDKKISDITNAIFSYKINIKKNKFIEAWMCLKQISFYVDFNNIDDEEKKNREKEKYSNIFTNERIELYNETVKKVNDAIKKIKNEKEMNIILENIFNADLFDNMYYKIFELYIWPYFEKIKQVLSNEFKFDQKPVIVQKFHLLLSRYCVNFLNMKDLDNFNCLCVEESNNNNYDNNNSINNEQNNIITNSNDSSNNNEKNNNYDNSNNNNDNQSSNNNDNNSQTEQNSFENNKNSINSE